MQKVFNRVQTPDPIKTIDSSKPDQSKPDQANSNSTILDKIKGLFGGGK
jgi:hypothetical protein